ncbi:threonine synthase [Limosilactobacillus difficilis]|uniref:threonine synthase n=1 Tax=Limosilactobacillus difficilis TaxID=2991838 RepID=UPI0024B8A0A4|nr:threonine synthase [Limosilactobacillus difficilis]
MQYRSTRGDEKTAINSATAVIQGLAPDGGLYVPVHFPKGQLDLKMLPGIDLPAASRFVLSTLMDDFPQDQLAASIQAAYGKQWDDPRITPLSEAKSGNYYLELFHGPTLAFKDVALQLLPHLMVHAQQLTGNHRDIVILTATSGDTGTASMDGFSNVAGTQVAVFYPHKGVSPIQLHQMLAEPGDNLAAYGVEGNFDDAQTNVKKIFNDQQMKQRLAEHGLQFSSANSMNIGRLIPQMAYYLYAYGQLVQRGAIQLGDPVNFAVPTGNFGDILAAYYCQQLGLPINKLICASNENNVLTDFFHSGNYDKRRTFTVTNAPSMDILVSSNLERLLFDAAGEDVAMVKKLMQQLNSVGHYQINAKMKDYLDQRFVADYADEQQVRDEITRLYQEARYAIDPHTAVASAVTHRYQINSHDQTPTVIVATASPYKFAETVYHSVTLRNDLGEPGLPAIKQLHQALGGELPKAVQALFERADRPEQVVEPAEMEAAIARQLQI